MGNSDMVIPPTTPPLDYPRSIGAHWVRPPTCPGWSPSTGCVRWSIPQPATAGELFSYGSVLEVVPAARLTEAAYRVEKDIAAKSPTIIRRAKESLNGIDPVDVKTSYRLEQGFTYKLHVAGVADEQRAAFVEKRDADTTR